MVESSHEVLQTVPARYMAELAERSGAGKAILADSLTAAAVPARALDIPRYRVTALEFNRFHRRLCRAVGDELFGYFERPVPIGSYATLVRFLTKVTDVSEAIDGWIRFYRLFDDHCYWQLGVNKRWATLAIHPRDAFQAGALSFSHCIALSLLRTVSWLSDRPIPLARVGLPGRFRPFASEARALFGCTPEFGSDRPTITFAAEVLARPVSRVAADADDYARSSLVHFMTPPASTALSGSLRSVLSAADPFANDTLQGAARKLKMSRATLARRLQDEGTSFQLVKDELRRDHAISLLINSQLGVAEIGYRIGYSEPRAFTRAFRDWTGVSPGQYRIARER